MSNLTVSERIKSEEGWKAHVYPDTLGFSTIGYGFLVDSRRGNGLPKQVADLWLHILLDEITEGLTNRWPPFIDQPQDIQGALECLAYQIGVDGVLGFHKMLAALQTGNRAEAAAQLLDSELHNQTPARTERTANLIRGV